MDVMKVRIGISLGPYATPEGLAAAVGPLKAAGIDSLWLSEVVYGDLVEPLIGMTYALANTSQLKVGTGVSVLPGRHPVLVAKQLTSAGGPGARRVLPVFGLRPARAGRKLTRSRFRAAGRPCSTSRWSCSGSCWQRTT